jgi:hypothetical protein
MLEHLKASGIEKAFDVLCDRFGSEKGLRVGVTALLQCYDVPFLSERVPALSREKNWGALMKQASQARELATFLDELLCVVRNPGEEYTWGEPRDLVQAGLRAGESLPMGITADNLTDATIAEVLRFLGGALRQIYKEWEGETGRLPKPLRVGGGQGNQFDFQDAALIGRLGTLFREMDAERDPLTHVIAPFRNATFPGKPPLTPEQVGDRLKRIEDLRKGAPAFRRIVFDLSSLFGCPHLGSREKFRPDPAAGYGMLRCPDCGVLGSFPARRPGEEALRFGFHPLPTTTTPHPRSGNPHNRGRSTSKKSARRRAQKTARK